MIENVINHDVLAVVGNIEMPEKRDILLASDSNTITSPCCVVSVGYCLTIMNCSH